MGYSRNSDQVTDRAMRPGMEPAVNATDKMLGNGWYPGLQAKPLFQASNERASKQR